MIEVSGLTKRFGSVTAVDDLSFAVKPGQVTGFLGPNGAGKSTTMRMILGLDRPTRGSATINGVDYRSLKNPLKTVGALLDAKAVTPSRSARNHLRWLAASNAIPASRVDEVLSIVGLTEVGKKKAGGFSLGMGQRLGLAAALLGDPEVLILDEPVNGLDPEGIHWVRNFLKARAAEGRTVFVSSHLLAEMALTADHLVVIGRGKLVADQSVHDFTAATGTSVVDVITPDHETFARVLADNGYPVATSVNSEGHTVLSVENQPATTIGDLAFSTGIRVHGLSSRSASLEEAYMKLTGDAVQYKTTHVGQPPAAPTTDTQKGW